MRTAFIDALMEAAEHDERIWLLCGDLGYSVLEGFAQRFPDRYLNVGVAEQNMTGIAAGLAMSGKTVFTYSIANFPTLRCLEQIRNDVCYHHANVKVVAVGGGLAYGAQGYTHFGVEDLAMMRALPNMTVVAPGDPVETRLATRAIANHTGPCYLRLGKAKETVVHNTPPDFAIGKAIRLRDGKDVALISTGGMLHTIVAAADLLEAEAISTQVWSMPTVAPLDEASVLYAAQTTRHLCVVEEHHTVGGLSDAIARCLVGRTRVAPLFMTLDTERLLASRVIGSQSHLAASMGLAPSEIAATLRRAIASSPTIDLHSTCEVNA